MAASIFNGSAVKILKDILRFKDGTDFSSTIAGYLSALRSDAQVQIDTKEKSFNWIDNSDFEIDATGWVRYRNTVDSAAPDDFGGTPSGVNLVLGVTTLNPLANVQSAVLTKANVSTLGEGAYYQFSYDSGYEGLLHGIKFLSEQDVNYVDGDFTVHLIGSNDSFVADFQSVIFQITARDILAGKGEYFTQFQEYTGLTDFRLCIHSSTTSALAYNFKFDEVKVMPDPDVIGQLSQTQATRFEQHAGYGSTATKIPYFTNETVTEGTGVYTVDNDSTNGLSITMLKDAVVDVLFSEAANTVGSETGVSRNSTQLTTDLSLINLENKIGLADRYSGGSGTASVGVGMKVSAGDVIRPHTDGHGFDFPTDSYFEITATSIGSEHILSHTENVEPTEHRLTSTVVLADSQNNNAPYNVAVSDKQGLVDTSSGTWVATLPSDGHYQVVMSAYHSGSNGSYRGNTITQAGSRNQLFKHTGAVDTFRDYCSTFDIIDGKKGDTLTAKFQTNGAGNTVVADASNSRITLKKFNSNVISAGLTSVFNTTNEYFTGEYWIDEKPIYARAYSWTGSTSSKVTLDNISNTYIDSVTEMVATAVVANEAGWIGLPRLGAGTSTAFTNFSWDNLSANDVAINTNQNITEARARIKYTKA